MRTAHLLLVTPLLAAALAGCKTDPDDVGTDPPEALEVVAVDPDDASNDVALDETVQLVFSHALDHQTVHGESVTLTTDGGVVAPGRLMPDQKTLLFTPALFAPSTTYTITVGEDVAGTHGGSLAAPFTASFTTGTTLLDGSAPRPDISPTGDARFITLTRQVEYVLVGADYSAADDGTLFLIDPMNGPDATPTEDEILDAWAVTGLGGQVPKQGVAGHLDKDPYEEVVLIRQDIEPFRMAGELLVVDAFDGWESLGVDLGIPGAGDGDHFHDVALHDVDGDGLQEIIVTTNQFPADWDGPRRAMFRVFDDRVAGHALLREMEILGDLDTGTGMWRDVGQVRVEIGNVDDDIADEIVLWVEVWDSVETTYATLRIVEDIDANWEELTRYDVPGYPASFDWDWTFGLSDFDGDGLVSIVRIDDDWYDEDPVCSYAGYATVWSFEGDALVVHASGEPAGISHVDHDVRCYDTPSPDKVAHLYDMNGDGVDELFMGGRTLAYNDLDGTFDVVSDYNFSMAPWADGPPGTGARATAVGDVNGDGREDLIVAYGDGAVRAFGLDAVLVGYDLELQPVYDESWRLLDERLGSGATWQEGLIVVPANLDDDSLLIEPRQALHPDDPAVDPFRISVDHRIVFSDDQIIAALAAPPCADGIGQNTEDCSTGLGVGSGSGSTLGASVRTWAGVSLGVEAETQIGLFGSVTAAKFLAKAIVTVETEIGASTRIESTTTITDFAAHGEDLVIFYTVPQHQYIYTIASHPDPTQVGSEVTVNVPIRAATYSVTRRYYNANNGTQADIGSDVFRHTPGDLGSYPHKGEMLQITAAHDTFGIIEPPVTVGQGSGHKEIALTISEEHAVEGKIEVGAEIEAEACVFGVCGGVVGGAAGAVYAGADYSTETVFISAVGAIDAEHWAEHMYDYGMFAYRGVLNDAYYDQPAQTFTVVNYYVQ